MESATRLHDRTGGPGSRAGGAGGVRVARRHRPALGALSQRGTPAATSRWSAPQRAARRAAAERAGPRRASGFRPDRLVRPDPIGTVNRWGTGPGTSVPAAAAFEALTERRRGTYLVRWSNGRRRFGFDASAASSLPPEHP